MIDSAIKHWAKLEIIGVIVYLELVWKVVLS